MTGHNTQEDENKYWSIFEITFRGKKRPMMVRTCSWRTSLYAIHTPKIFPSLAEQTALAGIEELEECDIGDMQVEEKLDAWDVEDVE
jgi:hypothetical protein